MNKVFEIYYETEGVTIYCGDIETEKEALDEINSLGKEFPMNRYWYETIEVCEQ